MPGICWGFLLVVLFAHSCHGFYLPGSYMHTYSTTDSIFAKVNSLTSIETELPFSYYSLPYCKPSGGIKKSAENLGELLMGDQIDNSPCRFRMNVNESLYLCTTNPLNEHEVKLLKQRTRDLYQVNMILDNLPVMRISKQNGINIQWTGFPVGYTPPNSNDDYIINHLKFKVLVHEYEGSGVEIIGTGEEGMGMISEADKKKASGFEIVGFEVVPCSVKYDPEVMTKLHMYDNISSVNCPLELDKSQIIREQERISFTYEVEFVKSDIRWPSRWDAYLKMEGARVHWFSIMNSLMVITFLAGIVFVIFLRTVRRDLTRYEELDKEAQAQMNEELSGWKLVVGDVFREPDCPKLLCDDWRWSSDYRNGSCHYSLCSLWFHVTSFTRNAIDRDDYSLPFLGYCCWVCCCMSLENSQGNFRRMEVRFLVGCVLLSWNCLCYPYSIEFYSVGQQKYWCNSHFFVFCTLVSLVLHFCSSHSLGRILRDQS
ncbi:hypothetical protein CRYUN_Cryun23aG0050800 [Craigia yunnanensis]